MTKSVLIHKQNHKEKDQTSKIPLNQDFIIFENKNRPNLVIFP
jgi:hypothetical protein